MPTLAENLVSRYDALKTPRYLFEPDWSDIVTYILPMAHDTLRRQSPGQSRMDDMFDETAMKANDRLAATMMGAISNQALDWHRLSMHRNVLKDDQETQAWLSAVNDHLLASYGTSNFYRVMHTFYLHLSAFGTAAVWIGDSTTSPVGFTPGLQFQHVPHGTYVVAENADGEVDTLLRVLHYTPLQAFQAFGKENVSAQVRDKATRAATQDQRIAFLHAVFPREGGDATSLNNRNFPWANVYIELDERHEVEHTGHREFPFMVARWQQVNDSPWGFGPGHMALPATRTLNRMKELQIQLMEIWVQPPLKQVHEGVIGAVSLEPLAVNVVRNKDDLTPLDITGRPDLIQISQDQLERTIRDIFFNTDLEGIPDPESGVRTAFEIGERLALMARNMGPAFHRLTTESFNNGIDRVFGLELRKGALPPPPPQVFEAMAEHQGQIDVEYLGPLARAMKAANTQAISQTYGVAEQIFKSTGDPSVFDPLDADIAIRRVAEASGVPPEMIRDTLLVAQQRQARAQAQQAQQEQASVRETTESLRNVTPLMKELREQQPEAVAV